MTIFTLLVTLGGVCLFFVCGASAVDPDRVSVSVMEGDAMTLYTGVEMNQDRMMWFFGDDRIAVINGDTSKICEDDQCKQRFRDRLNVNQNGSLTVTNIRTTDSGDCKLQISSSRFCIIRSFTVTVTYVSDSGSSSVVAVAVVVVVLLLLLLIAAAVYYKRQAIMKFIRRQRSDQKDDAEDSSREQTNALQKAPNGTSLNNTDVVSET
ncbi:uncharacterized protein [Sinocyclocheilus grahami]|uniref:uncharacterized protein n=1 Tax=Sinocyclocheilus grahami TaxID=75366 RepID=UPI0007AC5AA4|nr:PREDICTED: uncharacterized protein LOC107567324 [Sinocyclocheilus grahami]